MSRDEAFKKLDDWLLIPIDYESIIPALSEIRETREYETYVRKIAKAEFISSETVKQDVENYQVEASRKARCAADLNEKLDALAGGKRRTGPIPGSDDDVFSEIERTRREKTREEEDIERANANYQAYVQGYLFGKKEAQSTALVNCCHRCGAQLVGGYESAPPNMPLVVLLFLFCWPAAVAYLVFRKKRMMQNCPNCHARYYMD